MKRFGELWHAWSFASVATFLYWFAAHSLRPLVTLRLQELGASDALIAVTVAAYPFFSLFLAIPGGRLVDRVGVVRVLVASLVAMALVGVGYAVAVDPVHILLLQIVNGIVELAVWLALQALVTHAGAGRSLALQLSLFSLSWGLGVALGPIVGALVYDRAGFPPLGFIYASCSLAAVVCAAAVPYRGREDPAATGRGRTYAADIRSIVRRPAVKGVLLSSFVALYLNSLKMSFYPLFLERRGLSVSSIGVLLSIMGVASLAIRVPLPLLVRRWGRGKVLVWSMWLGITAMGLTPWLGPMALLVPAAVVIGAAYGLNPPLTVELMAFHTDPPERGLAMGLRVTANRVAQVFQPLVFGAAIGLVGMAGAFPLSWGLLAGFVYWTGRETERISAPRGDRSEGSVGG